jgi:hypothetical protein
MFERKISEAEIRSVIDTGQVIERYPDDVPYPSRLVLGWASGRAIHVVAADSPETGETIVITVYEPDPAQWEAGFRRRRER